MMLHLVLKYGFVIFYLFAGINHFINPDLYLPLIPDYFDSYKNLINLAAGLAEVTVAILMFFRSTTKLASYITIAMLIAFIPSHIYFIQKGDLPIGDITITPLIAWVRLLIIHPVLIYWAWWLSKERVQSNTLL